MTESTRGSLARGLLAGAAAVFLAGAWRHQWVAEDAYITYRFAKNWVRGFGIVFNPGLPAVEGYSDFLWLTVAAGFEAVGIPPWLGCNAVAVACGLAVLFLVDDLARRTLEVHPVASALAVFLLAAFPPFVKWSTSGLEPMPQTLLFLLAASGLGVRDGRAWMWVTAAAGLGLALIRTEGIYWSPVFVALGIGLRTLEGRAWRPIVARYVAVVGVGWGLHMAWKHGYYGPFVAQTASAKLELGTTFLGRGLKYVTLFALLELPVLLVPLGAWAGRDRVGAPRAAWVFSLAAAYPAWAVVVGGDYMAQYRFLVPSTPFMALCGALGLHVVLTRWDSVRAIALTAVLGLLGALSGENIALFPQRILVPLDISSGGSWEGEVQLRQGRFRPVRARKILGWEAIALQAFTEPGDRVVTAAIGYNGYFNDVILLDRCGLVSPEVLDAAKEIDADERPGHDRCVEPEFFHDAEPDVMHFDVVYDTTDPGRRLQRFADNWFGPRDGFERDYYPDYITLDAPDVPGGVVYGVGVRRAPDPKAARDGWKTWRDALRDLGAGRRSRGG